MARLVYGLQGDSRGHLARARIVARLLAGHEFLFVGGGAALELAREGRRVIEVPVSATVLRRGRVAPLATALVGLTALARTGPALARLIKSLKGYDPDLIIADYEFFTPLAARRLGRPCLGLDNQHLLTLARHSRPADQTMRRLATNFLIRSLYSFADYYLIPSLYPAEILDRERAALVGPLVRPEVLGLTPRRGEEVLVYLRAEGAARLTRELAGRPRRYLVYGPWPARTEANLVFKPVAEAEFLADLAGCRYVLTHGGLNLLAEALALGKPVLAVPVGGFYEQAVNAHHLALLGRGAVCWNPDRLDQAVADFEARLGEFDHVGPALATGNAALRDKLEALLAQGWGRARRR